MFIHMLQKALTHHPIDRIKPRAKPACYNPTNRKQGLNLYGQRRSLKRRLGFSRPKDSI